ncbi:MAG: anhydro-N-acetylmuramic acid kinase [Pseudomonadota bacterium]
MALYIGLISGTSLDAIDAAIVSFEDNAVELLQYSEHPYHQQTRQALQTVIAESASTPARTLYQLHVQVGVEFAQAASAALRSAKIAAPEITAIGSHGQTIAHFPDSSPPYSIQIGDPSTISVVSEITTVADFRAADLAAGGQGAPLVPPFHAQLFTGGADTAVILNIGGLANISVLRKDEDRVVGFDTGPGNTLMDLWITKHANQHFDKDGVWSKSGSCDEHLLKTLLDDPFFERAPPKSTGREYFNLDWLNQKLADAQLQAAQPQDVQATLMQLTVRSIASAIVEHVPDATMIIVCGGGALNGEILKQLDIALPEQSVITSAHFGVDPCAIEAMAFAWLAKQAIEGRPVATPPATGASKPVVLGGIYGNANR